MVRASVFQGKLHPGTDATQYRRGRVCCTWAKTCTVLAQLVAKWVNVQMRVRQGYVKPLQQQVVQNLTANCELQNAYFLTHFHAGAVACPIFPNDLSNIAFIYRFDAS